MTIFIIAEAGVNHNGDIQLAHRLIEEAKGCGANAVKFQTFKAEKLALRDTPKVPYQTQDAPDNIESHFDMLKRLELNEEQTIQLKNHCDQIGIEFMSTPYDPESVDFLYRIGSQKIKVASADLVDFQIQHAIRKTGLPVIQSMGMSTWEEVEYWNKDYSSFDPLYPRTLLQCTSNYPSDPFNANLLVMVQAREKFHIEVGFSDHTPDNRSALLSVALGASIIEKHFTLDKTMKGPDHKASMDPKELFKYCSAISDSMKILGDPHKIIAEEEMQMRKISRKGVYLTRPIAQGESIGIKDVIFRRPGTYMTMDIFQKMMPSVSTKNLDAGHALCPDDLKA